MTTPRTDPTGFVSHATVQDDGTVTDLDEQAGAEVVALSQPDPFDPAGFAQRFRVGDDGTLSGLDEQAGEDILLLTVPESMERERIDEALETPRTLAFELMAVFYEHKELTEEQADRFRERYGSLPGEELLENVQEVNRDIRERLEEVTEEVGAQYERVGNELETRLRDVLDLGSADGDGGGDIETPTRTIDLEEADEAGGEAAREAGAAASQPDAGDDTAAN